MHQFCRPALGGLVVGKGMEIFFSPVETAHQKRERAKARELRQSQWWRQQLGQGKCYYCGEKFAAADLTMDHKVPIVRGGKSTKKNVVVACRSCNQEKKYFLPGEQALLTPSENHDESGVERFDQDLE